MKRPSWFRRILAGTVTCALVGGVTVAIPAVAAADSTTLFQQSFHNSAPDGLGAVVKPAGIEQANTACLTATGADSPSLPSCPTNGGYVNDVNGSGALSLTPALTNKTGGVFAATSVPTSQGLDVSFTLHQYSSSANPADGLTFALAAVDPANPTAPPNIGPTGGSLGYAASPSVVGLSNAYLGLGFDAYGYYSSTSFFGTRDCSTSSFARPGRTPFQVVVRGPGNGLDGYCAINSTATSSASARVNLYGRTRTNSAIPVRVLINSSKSPITTADGLTASAESYLFQFTPIGATAPRVLTGSLPAMNSAYVGSPSWLDSDGVPKQLAFGWAAATGGLYMNQEVDNAVVKTLAAPVPQLQVAQTSYTPGATLSPGDPVNYVVTPAVAQGVNDNGPVVVSLTAPNGVLPRAASGDGWSCAAPAGQKIVCTNANGPFTAGQSLTPVTVTAVATGTVSASSVQNSTVTTVSSDTGQAGLATTAPAGQNTPAPSGTGARPNVGVTGGGNPVTLRGAGLAGATSVWVGTQDELNNGTASVLVPCSSTVTVRCFNRTEGGQLVVSKWPAHAAGSVIVKVVTLGNSNTSEYTYTEFTPGSLLVTEMRSSGPGGNGDSYVELTNTTTGPLPLTGVFVQSGDGLRLDLPASAQPLPAGASYLVSGPAYSLDSVAHADQAATGTDFAADGVRVLAPNAGVFVVTDTVGPAGSTYHEGAGLPALTGTPTDQYGWVRTQQTGAFKNTGDNAADFALVSTTGGVVGGVQSMLGSPSPTGLTSPQNASSTVTSTLLDPDKPANAAPNRVVTKPSGTAGRIETRRVITNNTGRPVTTVQLRLIDITEVNGLTPLTSAITPGSPVASLRAVQPVTPSVTVNGQTVRNLSPADPNTSANGGGLNSTFTVPLPGRGLMPGQSVPISLTFDASSAGKFSYRYSTEVATAS